MEFLLLLLLVIFTPPLASLITWMVDLMEGIKCRWMDEEWMEKMVKNEEKCV